MVYNVPPPVVIADDDRFAVPVGGEGISLVLQLGAQLFVVVDFAVEGQRVPVGLAFRAPL